LFLSRAYSGEIPERAKDRKLVDISPACQYKIELFNIPLNAAYGAGLNYARRYDEAITQLKKTIEMDADHRNAHTALVMAYSLKGMYPEAVEHRIIALRIANQHEWAESVRDGFAKAGWTGVLRAELERFGALGYSADRLPHYNKAHLLAALGEKDQAYAELENSLAKHEQPALVFLKTDPRLDPLRDDPRYKELLRKVGFPE
jgi:tetratricopeptide (TPR) repeat protein